LCTAQHARDELGAQQHCILHAWRRRCLDALPGAHRRREASDHIAPQQLRLPLDDALTVLLLLLALAAVRRKQLVQAVCAEHSEHIL
jgi:hypothetical protein